MPKLVHLHDQSGWWYKGRCGGGLCFVQDKTEAKYMTETEAAEIVAEYGDYKGGLSEVVAITSGKTKGVEAA